MLAILGINVVVLAPKKPPRTNQSVTIWAAFGTVGFACLVPNQQVLRTAAMNSYPLNSVDLHIPVNCGYPRKRPERGDECLLFSYLGPSSSIHDSRSVALH